MDYRNADGSLAEMCGNGIRLFVRYLVDEGLADPSGPIDGRHPRRREDPARRRRPDHRRPRCAAGAARDQGDDRRRHLAGRPTSTWATRTPSSFLDDEATLAALDLSRPPEHDASVYPDGVNVEFVVRRGERHVGDARARARLGRDPVVRHRHGRRAGRDGDGRRGAAPGDVPRRRPRRHPHAHLDRGRPRAARPARPSSWPGARPRSTASGRPPASRSGSLALLAHPPSGVHMDFEGASAVVTGGASGIGAAVRPPLAAQGARVVVADLQRREGRGASRARSAGCSCPSTSPTPPRSRRPSTRRWSWARCARWSARPASAGRSAPIGRDGELRLGARPRRLQEGHRDQPGRHLRRGPPRPPPR